MQVGTDFVSMFNFGWLWSSVLLSLLPVLQRSRITNVTVVMVMWNADNGIVGLRCCVRWAVVDLLTKTLSKDNRGICEQIIVCQLRYCMEMDNFQRGTFGVRDTTFLCILFARLALDISLRQLPTCYVLFVSLRRSGCSIIPVAVLIMDVIS